MPLLALYFLGPPRIEYAGQLIEPDTRKATALLAYLALTGERQSRDALSALLWPEYDEQRGRAALRRTLSTLKAITGDTPFFTSREIIGLEPGQFSGTPTATSSAWSQGSLSVMYTSFGTT